jgi:phosphate transport system permease protein
LQISSSAKLLIGDISITRNAVETLAIWTAAAAIIGVLLLPVIEIVSHGYEKISYEFIFENPADAGRSGGIGSVLVSTLLIVAVSLAVSVPLAFLTAVLLTEYLHHASRFATAVRASLDVLAGVPSVVFGLFGLAFFCRTLEMGYSIKAGGLTLACMILPTLCRSMCSALISVGDQFRISGAALCMSRVSVLFKVTIPVILPALVAGVILGLTRAIAETALLLFTSGYSDRMPGSISDSGRSISVHIYELATNVPGGTEAAYGSAFVLLLILAVLSVTVHLITNWLQKRLIHG